MEDKLLKLSEIIHHLDFLQPFFEHGKVGVMLVDADRRILWVNEVARQMNWCRQPLDDLSMQHPVCIEDGRCIGCAFQDVYKDEGRIVYFSSNSGIADDESSNAYDLISMPIRDDDGVPLFFLQFIEDITETEATFRDNVRLKIMLRNVLDNTADAVIALDQKNDIFSWNRGAWQVFGYSPEEVKGRYVGFLIPEENEAQRIFAGIQRTLNEQGFVRNHRARMQTRDRRQIDVAVTQTTVNDENGELIGHSLIVRDISNVVHLEDSLSSKIFQLEKLLQLDDIIRNSETLSDIFNAILVTVTAGEGLRFNRAFLMLVNPNLNRLEGMDAVGPSSMTEAHEIYSQHAQQGLTLADLIQQRKEYGDEYDSVVKSQIRTIEIPLSHSSHPLVRCLTENRPYLYLRGGNDDELLQPMLKAVPMEHFVAVPLVWRSKQIGLILADNFVTRRDISMEDVQLFYSFANRAASAMSNIQFQSDLNSKVEELKNAYRQLFDLKQESLQQERLAALGQMASKVAHEIRNPLASIGGFARLLSKLNPTMENRKYLDIISHEAERLEIILEEVLGYVRPTALEQVPADINGLLQEVLLLIQEKNKDLDITYHQNLDLNLPFVPISTHQIKQAVMNIMQNGVEATGRGGSLTISSRRNNDFIQITISDSGVGMNEEQLKNLFKPFVTTKSSGVGLGLSVTKELIERHNGTITATSMPNEGTTFTLHLPLTPKEADHDELDGQKTAHRG